MARQGQTQGWLVDVVTIGFAGGYRFQPKALAHGFGGDVQEFADGRVVIRQCRIVPAVR